MDNHLMINKGRMVGKTALGKASQQFYCYHCKYFRIEEVPLYSYDCWCVKARSGGHCEAGNTIACECFEEE